MRLLGGILVIGLVLGLSVGTEKAIAACATWHDLTNGTPADADDVMDNFDCLTTNPEFAGQVTVRTDTATGPSTVRIVNATDGTGSAARIDLAGGSTGQFSELTLMQFAPSHSGALFGVPLASLSAVFENTTPSLGSGLALGTVASHPLTLGTGNAARITITGAGDVGIATSAPSYTLHVNGSVAGTSAYNNLSDARLKKNVTPITHALAAIGRLQGVYFDWRRPGERSVGKGFKLPANQRQIGFLAQDVRKVLPEAVSVGNDRDRTLSLAESKIVPLLVEAVKELKADKERQAAKIERLQGRLDLMERREQARAAAAFNLTAMRGAQ